MLAVTAGVAVVHACSPPCTRCGMRLVAWATAAQHRPASRGRARVLADEGIEAVEFGQLGELVALVS